MNPKLKKMVIIGAILFGSLLLMCGIGGTWIYQNVMKSANDFDGQVATATKNGIFAGEPSEQAVPPTENAALTFKHAFDAWQVARPQISDERWESFIKGKAGEDESHEIDKLMMPVTTLIEQAGSQEVAQWSIDYSEFAFSSYPVWAAVVDGVDAEIQRRGFQDNPLRNQWIDTTQERLKVADHVLASGDPGSLRAAAAIRMSALTCLSRELPYMGFQSKNAGNIPGLISLLESVKPIDPLPVWRKTAFLQFETWENYDKLSAEQKKIFAGIPRDHPAMLDASSAEILKFWNTAIAEAQGKTQLEQLLLLAKNVEDLRAKPEQTQLALLRLWELDSAKSGAGSIDWLLAEEQRQLTLQALDVLLVAQTEFSKEFECRRISVIGMKPFTYEKTAKGFRLYAEPSNIIPDVSSLRDVGMVYEFN